MLQFAHKIAQAVAADLTGDADAVAALMTVQPDISRGDISLACFQFSRDLRKKPNEIAQAVCRRAVECPVVAKAEPAGGYANFFLRREHVLSEALKPLMDDQGRFTAGCTCSGQTMVIDFSSPNIAKPFGIHHIRSTAIGSALSRIWHALGATVVRINHVGDWGSQFGLLIVGFKRYGDSEAVARDPVKALYSLYVKINEDAERDPAIYDEARAEFLKLEQGDEENLKLWRWFRKESLRDFQKLYDLLDVSFEHTMGEAFYNDKSDGAIAFLRDKGLLSQSEGATVVDLEAFGMPPCILRKSDEATIYATRDIAAALYRHETFHFDQMLYVVGHEQSLHFKQLFKVLELAGCDWVSQCRHVPFALMRFADAKISTRRGNVIFLEDVLREAIERVRRVIAERREQAYRERVREKVLSDDETEEVARVVGTGAVVFNYLSVDNNREVLFDWDRVLDFNGETGPYVQYSHARMASILASAGAREPGEVDPAALNSDYEYELARTVLCLPIEIERARQNDQPARVARYLIGLTKAFNQFYDNCHVLKSTGALLNARLALVEATRSALAAGLKLLGMEAPEKM